jgi:hypothetical protein
MTTSNRQRLVGALASCADAISMRENMVKMGHEDRRVITQMHEIASTPSRWHAAAGP